MIKLKFEFLNFIENWKSYNYNECMFVKKVEKDICGIKKDSFNVFMNFDFLEYIVVILE